ncbi:MAG: response regulator [Acidobacteria bacterium]|nr:response regulator [Acidobacteriota bacterium]
MILVVEDSGDLADTLTVAFDGLGTVVPARNGLEALRVLSGECGARVRAIVTDLQMPRMDGFELLEKLQTEGAFHPRPVIVISGDTDPAVPGRVRGLGASAFFPKPFSPGEVKAKLEALLNAQGG